MSLGPGIEIEAPLREELRRIVERLPDDEVVAFARVSPAFRGGGFRPGQAAPARERIRQMLASAEPVDDVLRRLLARHSLNRQVVAILAPSFLADHYHALAALFGESPLLLAFLLDERPEVREQAARRLRPPRTTPPSPSPPAPAAAAELRAALRRLLDTLTAGETEAGEPAAPAGREAAARREERLRECPAALRRLKGAAARLERLRARLAESEEQRKRLQTALDEAHGETHDARAAAAEAAEELARDRAHAELRMRSLVETRLASEFAGWLGGSRREIAAAVAALPDGEETEQDSLLRRCDAALAAQAREDRVSGQRARLRERLRILEERLRRGREALAHAMRPLPELAAVVADLAAECARLRRLLGIEEGAALRLSLAAAVNTAPAEALAGWRATIERLAAAAALSPAEAALLEETLRLRQAMLHQQAGAPLPEPRPEELATPADRLRAALQGRVPAILLVDGHNVLFSLPSRYRRPSAAEFPDAAAREALVADLVRLTAGRPSCRARVVFDGPQRADLTAAANVGVTYSGGAGEHRADKVLLTETRYFVQAGAATVLLATNDGELGGAAARLGAAILSPLDLLGCFAAFARD